MNPANQYLFAKRDSGSPLLAVPRATLCMLEWLWTMSTASHLYRGDRISAHALRVQQEFGLEMLAVRIQMIRALHSTTVAHDDPIAKQ